MIYTIKEKGKKLSIEFSIEFNRVFKGQMEDTQVVWVYWNKRQIDMENKFMGEKLCWKT